VLIRNAIGVKQKWGKSSTRKKIMKPVDFYRLMGEIRLGFVRVNAM